MSPRPNPQTPADAPGLPLDAEVITPAASPATPETLAALQTLKPQPAATARPAAPAATPMALLQIAMDQGADLDRLERLMQMHERWEANNARKAFVSAFADFKAEPLRITKNKQVKFSTSKGVTEYWHATLDGVVEVLAPALAKHGLSYRWSVEQKAPRVFVTCILQHRDGHFETLTMDGPLDDSGNKNTIQQAGSTVTYLERYTLLAITGCATEDDDGRGATPKADAGAQMPEEDFQRHKAAIQGAETLEALQKAFVAGYNASGKDITTRNALTSLKDQRKRELQGGAR